MTISNEMQNCSSSPSIMISLKIFFKFLKKTSVKAKSRVRGRKAKAATIRRQPSALPGEPCHQFALAELRAATNNFHDDMIRCELGFGKVYEGHVHNGTQTVSVQPYGWSSLSGAEEFQLLCQLRHQNLVCLHGFCNEKDEKMLVYEYVNNGTLHDHLHTGGDPLLWKQRLETCIGAARGLHYLHTGARYTVIHRNVKSYIILLDQNWAAKLADFVVSKMVPPSTSKQKVLLTRTDSSIAGTFGYMAPEYIMNGELGENCNVFSFGVVLFEVLCGKLTYELIRIEGNLVSWICKSTKACSIYDTVDPHLEGKVAPVCLIEFVEIAFSCIHPKAIERPSMGEVEVTLELALELQEKVDSVMKAINPHGGHAYEEVPFHVSLRDYNEYLYEADINGDSFSAADE